MPAPILRNARPLTAGEKFLAARAKAKGLPVVKPQEATFEEYAKLEPKPIAKKTIPLRKTSAQESADATVKAIQSLAKHKSQLLPQKPVAKKTVANKPGTVSTEFADKLQALEQARALKNGWTNEFNRLEKDVKASFPDFNLAEYELQLEVKDTEGKDQSVSVAITKQTPEDGESVSYEIDKQKLRESVSDEIYEACVVPQVGLIEEFAGKLVAKKCITEVRTAIPAGGAIVTIKSTKLKNNKVATA